MKRILCLTLLVFVWLTLFLRLGVVAFEALAAGDSALWAVVCSFQYFTLTTTLLAALVLSVSVWRPGSWLAGPLYSGMVCVSLVLVALVYTLVLRHQWQPEGLRKLIDVLLHDFIPLFYLVYWWLCVAGQRLYWRSLLLWLIYPISYLAIILVVGSFTGSYPYPFLQVERLGYGQVLLNSVGLLAFYSFLAAVLLGLNRLKLHRITHRRSD